MQDRRSCERQHTLSQALGHLRFALRLLDQTTAPAEIGAHIDLAANQLELMVGEHEASQIERNADPQ